jgi:hypothetical protein
VEVVSVVGLFRFALHLFLFLKASFHDVVLLLLATITIRVVIVWLGMEIYFDNR